MTVATNKFEEASDFMDENVVPIMILNIVIKAIIPQTICIQTLSEDKMDSSNIN